VTHLVGKPDADGQQTPACAGSLLSGIVPNLAELNGNGAVSIYLDEIRIALDALPPTDEAAMAGLKQYNPRWTQPERSS
jgi:hypothetical protein